MRKRRRGSGRKPKKQERKRRVTARDQKKINQLIVNSIWRVKTADKETTSTGKVVYEQWSRCQIVNRMDSSEAFPEGAV